MRNAVLIVIVSLLCSCNGGDVEEQAGQPMVDRAPAATPLPVPDSIPDIELPPADPVADRERIVKLSLRALISSQEVYYSQHGRYARNASELDLITGEGVEITILEANEKGWSASATGPELGAGRTCVVYLGLPRPPAPATSEGVPVCTQ